MNLNFNILGRLNRGASIPWYLGDGLVPESTSYVLYDPLVAPDLATSYVNLANPGTKNASAPVAAPSHAQNTGWTFNGTTQYLTTGQNPANESTVIAWVEDAISGTYIFGATGSGNHQYLFRPISSTQMRVTRNFTSTNISPRMYGGVIAFSKNNIYLNGEKYGASASLAGAINVPLFIGCQNANGTASNFCGAKVLRFAYYDFTLTDAQVKAVSLAMLDYQVSSLNAYSQNVLALNPLLYYPCNETIGHVLLDHSGNNYHGEAFFCDIGFDGLKGKAFKSDATPLDTARPNGKIIDGQFINDNELTFTCLYKPSGSVSPQVRLYESHHAATANSPLGDYVAFELRNGNDLSFYLKEDGVAFASGTIALINTDWHFIACYNSLSTGVWGVVVDDTVYEFAKTSVVGVTANMNYQYPYLNDESDSLMQHVALFDRKLSGVELSTLEI